MHLLWQKPENTKNINLLQSPAGLELLALGGATEEPGVCALNQS